MRAPMTNAENDEKEQRAFKRIAATALMEILPLEKEIPVDSFYAETLDMSSGGIMFATDRKFKVGSLWKLKILLKDSAYFNAGWHRQDSANREEAVPAIGSVVWIKGAKETGFDVAMKIVHIDERHAVALNEFLSAL